MLKMKGTICIASSKEKSWEVLSDIEKITLWSETVVSAKSVGVLNKGIGAERVCKLNNDITITEKWTDWVEGESFTYQASDLPFVKSAKNTWSLVEENGKTYLTTESQVVFKGGIFGRLIQPVMRVAFKKMGANALAALKYLIENGHPYKGEYSSLPRPMAVC